jgi:SAM-dependent methyltransferase
LVSGSEPNKKKKKAVVLCPVCISPARVFLTRANVPVQQNFPFASQAAALAAVLGDLEMAVCEHCGFVFNAAFEPNKVPYGTGYDNAQNFSPGFTQYLQELSSRVRDKITGTQDSVNIVEVGCGNGYFLRQLVQSDAKLRGYGFDPSYRGPATQEDGRLRFEARFYDRSCTQISADAVICRHVIEHVGQPLELLTTIREALANSPKARIFIETPCVEWILRNRVFWDFFYEHCSLFSAASLANACEECGYRVERVLHTFGGQYLWLEATLEAPARQRVSEPEGIVQQALAFAEAERGLRQTWTQRLEQLKQAGATVAVWGAGAKGVTFVNLLDPDRSFVDCVVDINPNKQGRFIPGTGHPIVDHKQLASRSVDTAILMNPNYADEVRGLLCELPRSISLIS